jgi:hypothetical protein
MRKSKSKGPLEKAGACLYRYKPSGDYYARIERNGKEIRRSLEMTEGDEADSLAAVGVSLSPLRK